MWADVDGKESRELEQLGGGGDRGEDRGERKTSTAPHS